MPIPTHRPDCETRMWWTKCPGCKNKVLFLSCTCGSKVFLESGPPDWIKHYCNNADQEIACTKSPTHEIEINANSINPLIECPFCSEFMKGKNLAEHIKYFHANEPKSLPKKRKKNPGLISETRHTIDENGFLIIDILRDEKTKIKPDTLFPLTESPHPVWQTHNFAEIKSTSRKKSNSAKQAHTSFEKKPTHAKINKFRPQPHQKVNCPICKEECFYNELFNHVNFYHKEQNTKIVLAKFNREYERLLKNRLHRMSHK